MKIRHVRHKKINLKKSIKQNIRSNIKCQISLKLYKKPFHSLWLPSSSEQVEKFSVASAVVLVMNSRGLEGVFNPTFWSFLGSLKNDKTKKLIDYVGLVDQWITVFLLYFYLVNVMKSKAKICRKTPKNN